MGITENIIDCYQEIIRIWEPGDRIYLFGFSRGAYTARCLGAVLCFCGVPTHNKDCVPLRKDEKTLRSIARYAVTNVYQHVGSPKDTDYVEQRKELARQFRERYGAGTERDSNAYPHFIGVFDTVASLANIPFICVLLIAFGVAVAALSFALSFVALTPAVWASLIGVGAVVLLGAWYLQNHLKFAINLPGYSFWQTLHLTAAKMQFYDKSLNSNVGWARHALAIDERRASFDRVPWGNRGSDFPQRGAGNPLWLKQLWFAGNHSDIGGSYPENELRLSDIALQWMVEETQKIPGPLLFDSSVLKLYPSAAGMQHDESRGRLFKYAKKIDRALVKDATLHPTVLERFDLATVLQLDEAKPYRPTSLSIHQQLAAFYTEKTTVA